jgi:hypothetical protein
VLLICLGVHPDNPKAVAALRAMAVGAGLTSAKVWNISATLSSLKGRAVRTPSGWKLNAVGRVELKSLLGVPAAAPAASTLRAQLGALTSPDTRAFVEEAIGCIESGHYRAAVVLSWVGAMSVLFDHVVSKHLSAFNAEATRRDAKWKAAMTSDDLARLKEVDFLQVLEAISIIGKSVKNELEASLKLRNGCGHPNSLKIAEHKVNSHVETLVLNVFTKY